MDEEAEMMEKVPLPGRPKEDAERHGYTRGCGGCSSWSRGLGRQPHNEECRPKYKEAMKDHRREDLQSVLMQGQCVPGGLQSSAVHQMARECSPFPTTYLPFFAT